MLIVANLFTSLWLSSPFSLSIWYNHRKYCDKVLVKTSQRTSTGLYSVNMLIMLAEQYLHVGTIIYVFPVSSITLVDVSGRRIYKLSIRKAHPISKPNVEIEIA